MAEKPYMFVVNIQNSNNTVTGLFSSMWMTIVTLTSVGYGVLFPSTIMGKLIVIILSLWGAFVLSISVAVIRNMFELSEGEADAVKLIILNRAAANTILQALRFNMNKKSLKRAQNMIH